MEKEMAQDPAPEVSCEQITSTTKWLKSIAQAMNEHNDGFSRLGLSNLTDDELHRNQALAREASRQLTLLFADKSSKFTTTSQHQVMKFDMGSQSQEIKANLSNFGKFLEHFSKAKWLGDLVAPEFVEQKQLTVKLLANLQNPAKQKLQVQVNQQQSQCNYCCQWKFNTSSFCEHCLCCAHQYGRGCPYGCDAKATAILSKDAILYEGIKSGESSLEKLQGLAQMAEALAKACRKDASAREVVSKELAKKMKLLKDFAEAVNEVPKVLRQFLLIRAGSIGDISELKAWVSKEEADRVHKTLEEFRDEVNEEKVMRRLNMKRAASEGSWSCISKGSSKEEKKKNKAMVK
ncbi:unnamed protein product [Effrenium voratum]|nr:unnamed protein product [Effrenium voratum]